MLRIKILMLFIFASIITFGNNASIFFEKIPNNSAYSFGNIKTICEDRNGFIWFGTTNGLYFYNTNSIDKYEIEAGDSNAPNFLEVNKIYKDLNEDLWLCAQTGLYKLDNKRNIFFKQSFINDDSAVVSTVLNIVQWDSTNYLVLSKLGLFIYNTKSNSSKTLHKHIDNINFIGKSESGKLLIGADNGSFFVSNSLAETPTMLFSTNNDKINIIAEINDHYYIGYENNGIKRIDQTGQLIDELILVNEGNTYINASKATQIIKRTKGEIWISTYDGIIIINGNDRKIIQSNKINQLPSKLINTMYTDSKGGVWLGSLNGDICFYNELNYAFNHFRNISYQGDYTNSVVNCFAEDLNGDLWVGSVSHGTSLFNPETKQFGHRFLSYGDRNPLWDVKAMATSSDGTVWMGTTARGLVKSDTKSFVMKEENMGQLEMPYTISSIATSKTQLWVGTQNNGLYAKDLEREQWSHAELSVNLNISCNIIITTYLDANENLWVCTEKGLFLKNKESAQFKYLEGFSKFTSHKPYTICEDIAGNMLIGTKGGGIIIYNSKNKHFDEFLPNHFTRKLDIYSIICDEGGNIWFSSGMGIYAYHRNEKKVVAYSTPEGIHGSQYIPNSGFISSKGILYFGSSNGFSEIDPKRIKKNLRAPEVFFSKFMVNNQPYEIEDTVSNKSLQIINLSNIKLNHKQNTLSFNFITNNYIKPSKNRFKYRMINYNKNWIYTSDGKEISYTKIPAGKYIIEVLGANNNETWSHKPLTIHIEITPPIWRRWYAYLTYFIIVSLICLVIIRNIAFRQKMKKEILLERYKNEANENLIKEKQKFFINISHEFRTPLSLIISPINTLLQKFKYDSEGVEYLNIVRRNTDRLLRLTNQVLDLRLIEVGKIELKIQKTEIISLCKSTAQYFDLQLTDKQIEFTITSNFKSFSINIDPDKVEKIIYNLISNAIKFSHEKGKIDLTIDKKIIEESHYEGYEIVGEKLFGESLTIQLTDNGSGITSQLLPKIFNRFTSSSGQIYNSSGIGLNVSMEYAKLHKGNILVKSIPSQATCFMLNLPINSDISFEEEKYNHKHDLNQSNKEIAFAAVGNNNSNKVLLLAEDNYDLRMLLKKLLSKYYKLVVAKNGLQAIEIAKKIIPDIIVTDIRMPSKSGLEVTRELKKNPTTSLIPIIVLTAISDSDYHFKSIDYGADSFLTKPVDESLLLIQISNLLKSREKLFESTKKSNPADLSPNSETSNFIEKVSKVIKSNLHNPQFGVEHLAQELTVSRSTLLRKIKADSNQSVTEFIKDIRLQHAIDLLSTRQYNINEISELVGFSTPSYFSSNFKQKYGKSPSEYLRSKKK